MSDILLASNSRSKIRALGWLCSSDQLHALREIITGTPTSDTAGRDLLISHCIHLMPGLNNNQAFMQLVADLLGLGADLVAHIYNGKDHASDADHDSAMDVSEEEDSESEAPEEEAPKDMKSEEGVQQIKKPKVRRKSSGTQ